MDHREQLPIGAELVGEYRINGVLGHAYLLSSGTCQIVALNQCVNRKPSTDWNPVKTRVGWAVFQHRPDLTG